MSETDNYDCLKSQGIKDLIKRTQCVSSEDLIPVNIVSAGSAIIEKHRRALVRGACFSNAEFVSLTDQVDYVLGFVYVVDTGICIEHAWNADKDGEYFDLTAELFWEDTGTPNLKYFQLIQLSPKSVANIEEATSGLSSTLFRRMPEYFHLFRG